MSGLPPGPGHQGFTEAWRRREHIVDQFEDAWRRGQRPKLEDYLPEDAAERRAVLVELVRADFECRARAGEAVRLESYLERYPELAACRDYPELLHEVTRRLEGLKALGTSTYPDQGTGTSVPQSGAAGCRRDSGSDTQWEASGAHRYQPQHFHAKGGLGEVFLAHDAQLHRDVALKRIQKPRARDPESQRRFLLEAEITARLEHPGVVPVHGLVQDESGQPCYAMRFIQGQTLQEAIQQFHKMDQPGRDPGERSLALRQLLTRFIAVCNTIAYAHSRGILHRDLKPTNVMLGKYGETLVVDWGLAKPFERTEQQRAGGEKTLAPHPSPLPSPTGGTAGYGAGEEVGTQTGEAIGTPAYMSPEQAAGQWEAVGPASDIYSLGATLYALLTGKTPFEDPPILDKVRRGKFPAPRQVKKEVPRALEAICLKAMALEPENRYATPLELAGDLEHWLADEPASAHLERLRDRLTRFGRRHKHWVVSLLAIAAVVVVSLSAGLVLMSGLREQAQDKAIEARLERDKAENERQKANQERQSALEARLLAQQKETEATEFAQFLRNLFLSGDPTGLESSGFGRAQPRGPAMTVQELLKNGLLKLREGNLDAPLVRASVLDNLGSVYQSVGLVEEAEKLVLEALEIRERHLGKKHLDYASSLHNLATIRHIQGKSDEAEKLFRDALKIRKKELGDHLLVSDTLLRLAWVVSGHLGSWTDERVKEAEDLVREAVRIRQLCLGPTHRDVGVALIALGFIQIARDKKAEGVIAAGQGLTLLAGKDAAAQCLADYASVVFLLSQGEFEKALAPHQKVYNQLVAILGEEHPLAILLLGEHAGLLHRLGRIAEAEQAYRKAIELARHTPLYWHPRMPEALVTLADHVASKQNYAEAEALYREALELARRSKNESRIQELTKKIENMVQKQK